MQPASLSALKLWDPAAGGPPWPRSTVDPEGSLWASPFPGSWEGGGRRGGQGAPETGSPLAHPWTRTDVGDGWARGPGGWGWRGEGREVCCLERRKWSLESREEAGSLPRRPPQATPTPSVLDPRRGSSCPSCSQKPHIQGCAPGPRGYSSHRRAIAPSFLSAFSTQDFIFPSCSQKTGLFAFWE